MTEEKPKKSKMMMLMIGFIVIIILILAVHGIAVMKSNSEVKKAEDELIAGGYPMTLEEILPKSISSELNGASDFDQAFLVMTAASGKPYKKGLEAGDLAEPFLSIFNKFNNKNSSTNPLFDETEMVELAEFFNKEETKKLFAHLSAALQKEKTIFKKDYGLGFNLQVLEWINLYRIAKFYKLRINYEAQKGNRESAFQFLKEFLKLPQSLSYEIVYISQSFRLQIINRGLESILDYVAHFSLLDSELIELQKLYSVYNDKKPLQNGLNGQRILISNSLFYSNTPINFSNNFFEENYHSYFLKPMKNRDFAIYLKLMKMNTEGINYEMKDIFNPEYKNKIDDIFLTLSNVPRILVDNYSKFLRIFNALKLKISLTEAAIKCLDYKHANGKFPDSLKEIGAEIPDPATGGVFLYLNKGENAFIYSESEKYRNIFKIEVNNKEVFGVLIGKNKVLPSKPAESESNSP